MLKAFTFLAIILITVLGSVPGSGTEGNLEINPVDYTESRTVHTPSLKVDVWVNRGDGAVYYPGEDVKVYFKASQDCYLMVYGIDTRGDVNILYPYDDADAPWVEGGQTYRIPDKHDDYNFRISGPVGTEYVRAVASLDPFILPGWPRFSPNSKTDKVEILKMKQNEDPFDFMETVDCQLVPYCDDYASDLATLQVEYRYPRWYFYPRLYCSDYPWCCNWGGVWCISEPFGAEIWIDGVFYGITPLDISYLMVGKHFVCLYFNGCWVWRDYVCVEKDRTVNVRADIGSKYRYVNNYVIDKNYRSKTVKGKSIGKSYDHPKTRMKEETPQMKDQQRTKTERSKLKGEGENKPILGPRTNEQPYQKKKSKSSEVQAGEQIKDENRIRQTEELRQRLENHDETAKEKGKALNTGEDQQGTKMESWGLGRETKPMPEQRTDGRPYEEKKMESSKTNSNEALREQNRLRQPEEVGQQQNRQQEVTKEEAKAHNVGMESKPPTRSEGTQGIREDKPIRTERVESGRTRSNGSTKGR